MTTFTTEDRILAEKDGSFTINVEPIPFAGWVENNEVTASPPHIVDSGASVMSIKPVAWINEYDQLEPFNPDNRQEWIPLYTHRDMYFVLTSDSQIQFTQEFEVLSGERKLTVLNRTMDLIMAKTGQVIDSLEVQ
jgi:hypothetical protein